MSNPLRRYDAILQAVASHPNGIALPQLTSLTKIPRSTAHRLASSLCEINYLKIDEITGNYLLGPAILHLMKQNLLADNLLLAFKPALNIIATKLSETAFCAAFRDNGVYLMQTLVPPLKNQSHIYPGLGIRPLDKCSSSKAILSCLDYDSLKDLILNSNKDPDLNIKDAESFNIYFNELQEVASKGYAICDGEIAEGELSIACPVVLGNGCGLFSIGVVGPASRLKAKNIDEIVEVLHEGAGILVEDIFSV